jgi:molecular chaperone GrpE
MRKIVKDKKDKIEEINPEVENETLNNESIEEVEESDVSLEEQELSYKVQFLRANADFQNFKRRVERERREWMIAAQGSVLKKILPIVDDFDRAITNDQEGDITKEEKVWLEGFEIIKKKFMKTMTDLGVEEIPCDTPFDPELHEALITVDSDNHKEGEIVQVLNKGYRFRDEVLVHAKVSVAK